MSETLDGFGARMQALAAGGLAAAVATSLQTTAKAGMREARDLATTRLRRRSGRLVNSIFDDVRTVTAGTWEIALRAGGAAQGGDVKYAALQEYGGTVVPKKGKFLAIPTALAETAAGNPRFPGGPRTVPGLRFIPIRGGSQGILVRDIGKGAGRARSEVWYRLVRSSTVSPHHYLRDAVALMATRAHGDLLSTVRRAVARGE